MLDFIGKILNPVGLLLDVGVKVLGLPPEIANVAKIGTGVLTGNLISVIDGGVGLTGNLVERATTEYQPSRVTPAQGYAAQKKQDPRLGEFKKHLEAVRDNFEFIEDSFLPFFKNGAFGHPEMEAAMARPECPPQLREAILFMKSNPDLYAFLDTANGVGWKDGAVAVNDVHSAIYKITQQLPEERPVPARVLLDRQGRSDRESERGRLDPNFDEYLRALETLDANYRTYDAVTGRMDGAVTRDNLKKIRETPRASSVLKEAAQFLLEHEEYFSRLEQSARGGGRDGIIRRDDLQQALSHARNDVEKYRAPARRESALADESLSLEERVQLALLSIMDRVDDQTVGLMEDLEKAQDAQRDAKDDKERQKAASSLEKLQLRLQQLVERRKQMFDLMTNLSSKFNEMAKTAIQNMARA